MTTTNEDEHTDDDTTSGSRELGVEFGELDAQLEAHSYPASVDELVDEYGEHELVLPGGEESFGKALEPYSQGDDQQFSDASEVRQAVLSMIGTEALGDPHQSDRGVDSANEDSASF